MYYKGFEIERVPTDYTDDGYEYICYWDDEVAGGEDTYKKITALIDKMVRQGVTHESEVKELTQ